MDQLFARLFFVAYPIGLRRLAKRLDLDESIAKNHGLLCLIGLICHGIYNIFYSLAVTSIGVSLSAVLLNVATVFTAVFSALFFREKITPMKGMALVINILGCILAVTGGTLGLSALSIWGLFYGIMAGLCYALTALSGNWQGTERMPSS